jgi:hypothetical protein
MCKKIKSMLNVSSPWVIHYRKLQAMFKEDPQVKVELDEDKYEVKLYVSDADKAEALTKILKNSIDFGNITLKVTVIPPNYADTNIRDLYEKALEGNGAVFDYLTNPDLGKHYVIFKNEVIQYFSDDLSKAKGVTSTLYEDIAEDIFIERAAMSYSTELGKNVIKD